MKQLITILLCLFTLFTQAQVNPNDTTKYFKSYDYGFSYKRLQAREAFIMPTDTVINKLGAVSLNGNIYLGNGIKWTSIGGGTTIDTTSLSNRINQRIDSLRRRSDSVFARKNGVFVFQYKDSVGTTIDTTFLSNRINLKIDSLKRISDSVFAYKNGNRVFQFKDSVDVTGSGSQYYIPKWSSTKVLSNSQIFDSVNVGINTITPQYKLDVNGTGKINDIFFLNGTYGGKRIFGDNLLEYQSNDSVTQHLFTNEVGSDSLSYGTFGGANAYLVKMKAFKLGQIGQIGTAILRLSGDQDDEKFTFLTNGDLIDKKLATNGADKMVTVDSLGKLKSQLIPSGSGPTIDTTNQFVKRLTRTSGKDSIIYFVGGNRFAIKDSVGTNPAPVGYYGSFYDTTTQTALVTNTAYGVKLGVTDLTNGVTVANNSKIKFANAGIYNIQFSLQLEKTGGSGNMIADIWLRKNDINLVGTNGKIVLTGSANASPVVAAWNYVVAISSNDSLELMWATDNLNVKIITASASSPHPSTASAILTVTQQSGIMAGTGISPLDTANMLLPYLRKIDTITLSNRINLKLNTADTSTLSNRINLKLNTADTSTLSNRINLKLNTADTATMLSKYLRKIDTATLSNRINLKLNIADTSTLQPKSISAYTILANNTSATANATAQYFKDTSGTYTGTISWNGTAPTGGNLTYRWTRIGKMVNINISLIYSTQGSSNSTLTVTLPSDAPTPSKPVGLTSASNQLYPIVGSVNITNQSTLTNSATRGFLRNNAANNGFEFILNYAASTAANAYITCIYFTD